MNVGTVPGGVAELILDEALGVDVVLGLDVVLGAVTVDVPSVPVSEETATPFGSTRPNSWKTCAQSNRESISVSTASVRAWR